MPACCSRASTSGTPPASYSSVATYCPPGCRSHSSGVRSEIASNSSISSGTPISRATASRCSTPLVEPPLVATAAIAFSSAGLVMISLGRWPRRSTSITSSPTCTATSSLRPSSAGTIAVPAGEIPSASKAIAIVLAVNCPPHAPAPGEAASSSSCSSCSVILPDANSPTASNTCWIVTSAPL